MKTLRVALIPGDGIGPEVTRVATNVVAAVGERHAVGGGSATTEVGSFIVGCLS